MASNGMEAAAVAVPTMKLRRLKPVFEGRFGIKLPRIPQRWGVIAPRGRGSITCERSLGSGEGRAATFLGASGRQVSSAGHEVFDPYPNHACQHQRDEENDQNVDTTSGLLCLIGGYLFHR